MENNAETNEGAHVARNGNRRRKVAKKIPCVSKELFDQPPQSDNTLAQIFYTVLHSTFIALSKIRLGQIIISILDYYMVKILFTLDFCHYDTWDSLMFADDEIIERHKELTIKERPMAWIFFIPTLILLRILRFTLSVYCIVFGKGEVTAQQMQLKVIQFRRYYRSIRHYAVNAWTEQEKKLIEERKTWIFWRIYYRLYETIFMTKRIVEKHSDGSGNEPDQPENTETSSNGRNKKSLNVSSSSSSSSLDSDDELNPIELMDKYVELNSSADPDYVPESLNSTFDSTLGTDDDREKTESQMKLNEENHASNTYSSDFERTETEKSNKATHLSSSSSLSAAQMNELEKEIMAKILSYFKENNNFPSTNDNLNEIFYSPIGSPPEKAYNSDPELQNGQQ